MERKYEVKTYRTFYDCDKCGDGDFVYVSGAPQTGYLHKCDNCGCEMWFDRIYPYDEEKLVRIGYE